MNEKRNRWARPDFEEVPLGAEVTAYLGTDVYPSREQLFYMERRYVAC
jgi:coenzyme PQQ precursor peptide PqqA